MRRTQVRDAMASLHARRPRFRGWLHQIAFVGTIPAAILGVFFLITAAIVRDTPADAGHLDFDTGDASSGDI